MIKKNIPNFFTLCNLLCGCIAIVFAFENNLVWAAYMVGFSCLFDFLDGMVARMLDAHSEIGKQLDSLADMVSFGVVPGIMMFKLLSISCGVVWATEIAEKISHSGQMQVADTMAILFPPILSFLIPIFSAIRLAKFNIDLRQSNSFIGLPTPASSIFICSLPLIINLKPFPYESLYNGALSVSANALGVTFNPLQYLLGENPSFERVLLINPIFLSCLIVVISLLLIAPLPLFALKFKNFLWADNKVRYVFLVLSLVLLIVFKFVGIPLIIILYIILSVLNNLVSKNKNATPTNYE